MKRVSTRFIGGFYLLALLGGFFLLALSACGGGSAGGQDPVDPVAGLLRPVSGPDDLETSIKAGFSEIRGADNAGLAATAGAGADANFTGTYTQEKNVDEFDAVQYDGSLLYVAPRRFLDCCYILANGTPDGAVDTGGDPQRSIRILSTDPINGTATLQSSIPLQENISVQGMYLADDRMFALTGESIYGAYGGLWADFSIWAPEKLGYRVYDVSDPAAPALQLEASIDGIFVESRRIGDIVYIVSRYSPQIDGLIYDVRTAADQVHNQAILSAVSLADLLPTITINGASSELVDAGNCFVGNSDEDSGYPVITSVTAVPISNPTAFTTTCYNEEAYGVYVSEAAIYFTEARLQADLRTVTTRIHKFSLNNASLSYAGSAEIDGQVWRGGQADFRMSEHAGDLRLLASKFDWDNEDFVDHKLFVLRESATLPELEIISELPNSRRPEEIGKPNEALYGVRFLADRAYAVTFERIDPLIVIDLADPADPGIAGELEVTGFSDFLHPVNDELLLGLGSGGNGGIKLELFDVSNINQPLSRGSTTLGGLGSYSEARYDRHAFTYLADVNGVDRFTIPAEIFDAAGTYSTTQSGLHLFEIRDKTMPALASLNTVGAIVPKIAGDSFPFSTRNRAVIHDNAVYYIRNEQVWSAFWGSPTIVTGPQ